MGFESILVFDANRDVVVKAQLTLSHKHLVHIEQNVATFDNHPFDGQIFAQVFRFGDFIMHLPRQIFQLLPCILQTLPFDMIVGCVRQQFVQSDYVSGNLSAK